MSRSDLAKAFKDKPEVYEQKASEVLAADPDASQPTSEEIMVEEEICKNA